MKKQLLVALFSISQFAMASQSIEKLEADCLNHQDVACVRLGYLYLTGNGVAVSAIKASDYLKKGCDLNNGSACGAIGGLYEEGKGVEKSYLQAKKYYEKGSYVPGCQV